jgi:hypothetical protein
MVLSRRKKKPVVPAGSRSTASVGGATASQRSSSQLAGKRKANELANSGESFEPANRRPAPEGGSTPLPACASAVTGGQAAACSRQLGPPERGVTYAAVLGGPVAPFQVSGSLRPTAMGSDQSETAVSHETDNRRMSSDMSGPLSKSRMAPLNTPRWPKPADKQDSILIRLPFVLHESVTPVPSWPSCGRFGLAV